MNAKLIKSCKITRISKAQRFEPIAKTSLTVSFLQCSQPHSSHIKGNFNVNSQLFAFIIKVVP